VLDGIPELKAAERVPTELFSAYVEPHIEQGPLLDDADQAIGIVEAIVGMQHVEIHVTGDQNHAGTTPMDRRRDAVMGFVALAQVIDTAFRAEAGPTTVWTFGRVTVTPNATSIVPGRVDAMLQVRDPDQARLDHLVGRARQIAASLTEKGPVNIQTRVVAVLPPAPMNATWVDRLARHAERLSPGRWRRMVSGALHDAVPVSRVLPTAMVFVPSVEGKSHCFEEDTKQGDLVQGCTVLGSAVAELFRIEGC
jgi:N-carbamoyl-L-amino-acid hydrolase